MECPKSIIEVQEYAGSMPMTVASLEVTAHIIFQQKYIFSCNTKEIEPVFHKLYSEVH